MATTTRTPFNTKVSTEAHAGWTTLAANQGVTVAGLVGALGELYAENGTVPGIGTLTERAKELDAANRSRVGRAGRPTNEQRVLRQAEAAAASA